MPHDKRSPLSNCGDLESPDRDGGFSGHQEDVKRRRLRIEDWAVSSSVGVHQMNGQAILALTDPSRSTRKPQLDDAPLHFGITRDGGHFSALDRNGPVIETAYGTGGDHSSPRAEGNGDEHNQIDGATGRPFA